MVFPGAGPLPRHPSQLYEAFLEGAVIFAVMWALSYRRRPKGAYVGLLLLLYGVFRIAVESLREPDPQIGYIGGFATMGQLLSVPLVLTGAWLLWKAFTGSAARDGRTR
jgi:phosphatidylglycerol:prolipoprotein diacylglycerol transferase